MTATLAADAARAFRTRQAKARSVVASGKMDARAATERLLPWLAIACLCGAELPELEPLLEGFVPLVGAIPDQATRRSIIAEELCPRARWAPLLAASRDAALDAGVPEFEADRALVRLARALEHDPNRRHPIPPYRPRMNENRSAAA